MGFNDSFLLGLYAELDRILQIQGANQTNEIGTYLKAPFKSSSIIQVMNLWVGKVDSLLDLATETTGSPRSKECQQLFRERGITFKEFYYLFADTLEDEVDYLAFPAYVFTGIFSKDLRKQFCRQFEYTESSYQEYVLSLDLEPIRYIKKQINFSVPRTLLHNHLYLVAKTRSGKSSLVTNLVHNQILSKNSDTSLLILDPHGEFASNLRRLKILQNRLEDVVYIDPMLDTKFTPILNPFQCDSSDIDYLPYMTDSILEAFKQLLDQNSLSGNMVRLLRHLIYVVLLKEGAGMLDLLTILTAMSKNRGKKVTSFDDAEQALMDFGCSVSDPLTRAFFQSGYQTVDARTFGACIERIDGILSHPIVRSFVTGRSTVELERHLNSGSIVIANLNFTSLGDLGSAAISRLIVSASQNISAKRNRIPKHKRPRSILILDECQRLVSPSIERGLSEFAKFNTSLLLVHQYISQIDDTMVQAMISNTETKIIGRNSASSLRYLAHDIGMSADELMQMKKYQFCMKTGDRDPFVFHCSDKLVEYDEHNPHFISEDEAKQTFDKYMLSKYYTRKVQHNYDRSQTRELIVTLNEEDF